MPRRANNAGGKVFQRKDGLWVCAVSLPNGKRQYLYGKTEAIVEKARAELLAQIADGSAVGSDRQTVAQYATWWMEHVAKQRVSPGTYRLYGHRLRIHVIPTLGKIRLNRLTVMQVQSMLNALAKDHSSSTVVGIRGLLRTILRAAERQGYLARNVAALAEPISLQRKKVVPLTVDETRKLLKGIDGHRLEALYVLAITTGLRQGELLGLLWSDVDLEAGVLTLTHQLQRVNGEYQRVRLKTEQSRRTLPLPQLAVTHLRAHRARQAEERLLAGPDWLPNDLIFCNHIGGALSGSTINTRFGALVAKLGLPHTRFHDLRHLAASLMRARRVPMVDVSEMLGHSRVATTADIYAHLYPETKRAIADEMDEVLRG